MVELMFQLRGEVEGRWLSGGGVVRRLGGGMVVVW